MDSDTFERYGRIIVAVIIVAAFISLAGIFGAKLVLQAEGITGI